MKLRMLCVKCTNRYVDELPLIEQRDDGLYHVTCPNKHETVVWLQNHKFELLLDSGGMAFLDGYPREAVSSIAASFERFLEFYTRVMLLKHGVSPQEINQTWKLVARQSERQLGAFLFVSLLEQKASPHFIENKHTEFRNNVIHNGYIPLAEETMKYGEVIFQFIRALLNQIKATSPEILSQMTVERALHVASKHPKVTTLGIPTMISTTYPPDTGPKSFGEGLAHLREVKPQAYGG